MNHLSLVIKREYLTKIRNKSFIVMTFMSPLIMVGIFALVAYLSQLNNEKIRVIDVLDESGMFRGYLQGNENISFEMLSEETSLEEAKTNSSESEDYGLLYIPKTSTIAELESSIVFYSEDSPALTMMNDLENALESRANALKLEEAGYDATTIKNLRLNIRPKLETFAGEETSKMGSGLKLIFGGAAGYLLFMFIIIYGNMIMRSVIEEKTSRIVEVIISSVKPTKLLLGKIIGTSLAGVTQFAAWVVLIGVFGWVITAIFGIDPSAMQQQQAATQAAAMGGMEKMVQDVFMEISNLPILNLIVMFLLFFVGGYLLYASLYASVGAAVDSETDTQQFIFPILMPLILAVYVGFFTVIDNPHGMVSQVFSYIPFTSPVVMLMRIPFGVPLWQQLISVAILFITFFATVWLAAKIYRVGILMYGKKASYKELIKWLKY
ncbi:ABC transporter permease [Altibacter sp. HG106]|uniref:ABC transporter permease n=1 Tax=Altibacter sp. HG106 TaxID=3023937 RepID=UPI0023508CFB|nr:ABC transporter permease [Altibacter sp. HG106]MDC7995762.1 ABC transporter permease [Altibacter sp. HG106]